ncbi:MAG: 3-deoxy-7-phosphoheptulonate synthase [Phycisphaerales bacterium]|nr:MAG: 3-deoxy-7-phosphoheptulonate synthase [Phycisphaerales bacterium]
MIVVMEPGCSDSDVQHVVKLIRQLGLRDHVIVGTDRTVVAAIGDKRGIDKGAIETAPMVERVVPILAPYKVASREVKKEPSVVSLGVPGAAIGGTRIGVIAGPCSVENEEQILTAAHAVREAGAIGLRGGAFKPRTNPYAFQGLGEAGLKLLVKAREATGLAVVTEVMSVDQVDLVASYADVLQVGARNMQNFNLLRAVGHCPKPVLLKRGMAASLDEFLLAAEYIINAGNPDVILCERGIRTSESYVRNTLALGVVPAVKRASHLPIVVDPSHGTGHAYMVPAMCRAAIAAGADGVIVEVHPDPEHALTDGAQSITCQTFARTMKELSAVASAVGRTL